MVESGKNIFSLIFFKNGAVKEFNEAIDISFRFFAYMLLPKREIFHSYEKSREFFTFFSFLDQSSCMKG